MRNRVLLSHISLLVLVFCLSFGQSVTSFAQSCEMLFKDKSPTFFAKITRAYKIRQLDKRANTKVIEEWRKDVANEFRSSEEAPTVQVLSLPAPNDNLIVLRRNILKPWYSRASSLSTGQDRQGSPVHNFLSFGKYTSLALNMRAINRQTMVVPSETLYTESLQVLSRELSYLGYEPIPLYFYSQKHLGFEEYSNNFSQKLGLPVASFKESPVHFVHDVSYHYSAILLPPIYIRALQQKISLISDIINFLNSSQVNQSNPLLRSYVRTMVRFRTESIDFGTANTALVLASRHDPATTGIVTFSKRTILNSIFDYLDIPPGSKNREEKLKIAETIQQFVNQPHIRERYPLILDKSISEPLRQIDKFEEAIIKRQAELEHAALEVLLKSK